MQESGLHQHPGHVGKNLTVPFWQFRDQGLHIDSPSTHCQFKAASSGAVSSEDNLGWYYNSRYNPKFRCTKDTKSTTQRWFGAHL